MTIIILILGSLVILWVVGSTIFGHRRQISDALAGRPIRDAETSMCCNAELGPLRWSQDGWVKPCSDCGRFEFFGDDFDNPPPGRDTHPAYPAFARPGETEALARAAEDFGLAPPLADLNRQLVSGTGLEVTSVLGAAASVTDEGLIVGGPNHAFHSGRIRIIPSDIPKAQEHGWRVVETLTGSSDDFATVERTYEEHMANTRRLQGEGTSDNADFSQFVERIDIADEGDLLVTPPPPNIGGEGNPAYEGPHYGDDELSPLPAEVPYDLLREPPEGAAVRLVTGEEDDAE